jgi:outer membrane beta-barrel protein
MKQNVLTGVVLGFLLLLPVSAMCDDSKESETEEKVAAIQNRVFFRYHELGLSTGYIADDDFFHIYPLAASYTFNYSELWSLEVFRFQYMFTQEKDLKGELLELGVEPSRYPEQKYALHSHLIIKPFYGKSAFFNRSIINHETYFFAGGGVTQYEWLRSYGESETENAPSLSFGGGMKFFLNDRFCLNFEIRDVVNIREDDTENNVFFGLGLGFRFDLSPRESETDPTVEKLKEILDR